MSLRTPSEYLSDLRRDAQLPIERVGQHQGQLTATVMDVAMPVLDGIQATRLIKAVDTTRHARVIAYTGNPSFDANPRGALFAAVLHKPATPDAVLATVQRLPLCRLIVLRW